MIVHFVEFHWSGIHIRIKKSYVRFVLLSFGNIILFSFQSLKVKEKKIPRIFRSFDESANNISAFFFPSYFLRENWPSEGGMRHGASNPA